MAQEDGMVFQVGDSKIYSLCMISNLYADFGKGSDLPCLVLCSVCIIDHDQGSGGMGGDIMFFDKCSADRTAGASAVDQSGSGYLGNVF